MQFTMHQAILRAKIWISCASQGKGKMCKKDPDPEVYLSEASVHRRLDCIFPTEYPIDLDKEIRDVVVSRGFLSKKYGGDARSTIPTIAEKHIRVHHVRNWMYPNLMYNPYAPALPGHRGLFFQPRGVIPEIPWRNIRYRVITRVFETQWNYVGEYEVIAVVSLLLSITVQY